MSNNYITNVLTLKLGSCKDNNNNNNNIYLLQLGCYPVAVVKMDERN